MLKQETLDLLDSEIRNDYDRYKGYPYKDRYKLFTHPTVRIDPFWAGKVYTDEISKYIDNFKWSNPVRYSEYPDFKSIIATEDIGIYIVIGKPHTLMLNLPQHVFYVGISGEDGKGRPLRDRLTDYLYFSKIKLRDNIHQMLQMYLEEAYIIYSTYKGTFEELEKLEIAFHEYLSPLYSKRDFKPETKKAKRSWNL